MVASQRGSSGREAAAALGTDSRATDSSDTTSSDETSNAGSTDSLSSSSESDVARAAHGAPTRAETWLEHEKNHGPNHDCARCVWIRQRENYDRVLVNQDKAGGTGRGQQTMDHDD